MSRLSTLLCPLLLPPLLLLVGAPHAAPAATTPCRIEIVDKSNGWPVPLVELRTDNHLRFISDNAGIIACDAPELFGRETWFDISGHGYTVKPDGFKFRGVRLTPQPGTTLRVEVERINIAKRLGRITGGGIFGESQQLGDHLDWKESGIFGCDTVQNAVHRGQLFWLWGDTVVPRYPLGIFTSSGAWSDLHPIKKWEPPLKLPLKIFQDEAGKPRGITNVPGPGPTWVTGVTSIPDKSGTPRLVGTYAKIEGFLSVYESGLCVWNEEKAIFEPHRVLWKKSGAAPKPKVLPDGQAAFWKDETGKDWLLFGNPAPYLRCSATFEAWEEPASWEILKPQTSFTSATDESSIQSHTGAIAWHPWRKRWVAIFMQLDGKPSRLGEIWYAEAPAPTGPWSKVIKVVTHDNYTFYNPRIHSEFFEQDSPILIFEGTYTAQFADHPIVTPRYDYNQILYRLDLDDPALAPVQGGTSK